jgi:hypothetical protein
MIGYDMMGYGNRTQVASQKGQSSPPRGHPLPPPPHKTYFQKRSRRFPPRPNPLETPIFDQLFSWTSNPGPKNLPIFPSETPVSSSTNSSAILPTRVPAPLPRRLGAGGFIRFPKRPIPRALKTCPARLHNLTTCKNSRSKVKQDDCDFKLSPVPKKEEMVLQVYRVSAGFHQECDMVLLIFGRLFLFNHT